MWAIMSNFYLCCIPQPLYNVLLGEAPLTHTSLLLLSYEQCVHALP